MAATDTHTVRREVDLDIDVEDLWRLVSQPEELATWLGDDVDVELTPGSTGHIVDDGVTHRVRVDELVEGERISWRWWRDDDPGRVSASRVELVVAPTATGSRLLVTETRLPTTGSATASVATRPAARSRLRWELRAAMLHLVASAAFVPA